MPGSYTITTRSDGEVLTASKYNTDHQNHIDHMEPAYVDDYSVNTSQMRSQVDPGESGSESLATTLAAELERIRYRLAEISGMTYWYQTGTGVRAQSIAAASFPAAGTAGRLAWQSDGVKGLRADSGTAWISPGQTINVKNFGATGDGVTNDAANVQAAVTAIIANGGGTLYFPKGTYLVGTNITIPAGHNVYLVGDGEASVIKATTGVTSNIGVVAFGLNAGFGSAPCTSIGASHLKFDGNNLCRALYVHTCTRGLFTNIWSGNSTGGAFQCWSSTDITLAYSHIENGNGQYGDGVYFESATRPKVLYNFIYDFERIGVVMEGVPGANTFDALIHGNDIQYGHNATNPESNVGIWVENCERAYITDNRMANLTNTPGLSSRGITLGIVTPVGVPEFIVTGNRIADAQIGIAVGIGSTARVLISSNTIGGTGNLIGIHISSAQTIQIEHCAFGPSVHTAGSHGAIVLDTTTTISRLTVNNCTVTGTTYSGDSADFNIYGISGGTLSFVGLTGLFQWKTMFRAAPYELHVNDCYLSATTTNYAFLGATNYCQASNSTFVDSGAAGNKGYSSSAATGTYRFDNCRFDGILHAAYSAATTLTYFYNNCSFYNCQITVDAIANFYFNSCYISGYPAPGFIRGNYSNLALHIRFKSTEVISSVDRNLCNVWNYQPTSLILQDINHSTAIVTLNSMTPAATGYTVVNVLP